MKPKSQTIRSKKWFARSFYLKVPMRTNSAEVLKAGTVVTTTGELTKSRWFVGVTYPVIYKRGVMRLEYWVRRKDLLNPILATPTKLVIKRSKTLERALRKIENLRPFRRSL